MIRVAFVLPHLRPGGAERCVVNWIGTLDRSRYRPLLMLNRVEGAFLDMLPDDVMPIALGGQRTAMLSRKLASVLTERRVDVAYSATNAMNLALLAARTSVRRIVSEHTPPQAYLAEAKLPLLRRFAMRRLYPRADAVAVPTDRIGVELSAVIKQHLPVTTIPNPVVGKIITAPKDRQTDGIFRILSAGRLVPAKGFDTLIDACAALAASGVAYHLDIYGEGASRDALAQRIASAGLADRVTLTGAGDLTEAMRAADLFVLASRREGFGNVIVEAMAAGLPVLATRSGGPETIIDHGRNGWLVAPDDASALGEALIRLARDPDRERVVTAARYTAQRYDIAPSTELLSALIDRVVAARYMVA